jgi:hypothetical protein
VIPVTEVEVRGFSEADRAQLLALSGRVGEDVPTASLWGHEESEAAVYLTPYLDHEPDSVFVAVVDGEPAGYLAGSLGTAVPSESARMDRAIREYRLFLRRGHRSTRAGEQVQAVGRVARCRATAPSARLRQATSVQPAFAMRRASSGWAGQSLIDSPRYT